MKHNDLLPREKFNMMTASLGEQLVSLSNSTLDYDGVYIIVKMLMNSYINAITPTVDDKED